jgi:hypothetical protein
VCCPGVLAEGSRRSRIASWAAREGVMHLKEEKNASRKRRYPALYERLIPIALVILLVAFVVLIVVIVCVSTGLFP